MKRVRFVGLTVVSLWSALVAPRLSLGEAPLLNASASAQTANIWLTSCDSDSCDCDCEAGCCRESYWFAGTEVTFVSLDAHTGGRATLSLDDSSTVGQDISLIGAEGVDEHLTFAPRLWIGRQLNEDWGIVGRYWELNDSEARFPTVAPGNTPLPNFATFGDTAQVEMYNIDLEVVRSAEWGKWKFDASAGGRHASFEAAGRLDAFGVFTTGNFINLRYDTFTAFEGDGITASLGARRQLGDSRAYLFIMGRGSNLQGDSRSGSRTVGTVASSPSAPLVGAATVTRTVNDETELEIVEAQVGLHLEHPLAFAPVTAFFRTAFEYQFWYIDAPPVGGAGFGGTIGTLTTNSFASASNGEAKLLGLSISTGFSW